MCVDLYKKIEHLYKENSKALIVFFLTFGIFFTIFQSWVVKPTDFNTLIQITWPIVVLTIPIILIFIFDNYSIYGVFGIIYLFLAITITFTDFLFFIESAYGIISLSISIWLLSDFLNIKLHNKSLISELKKGNFRLLLCLFFVSFFMGWILEAVTEPMEYWTYYYPVPSLVIGNVYFITLMGWFLWILVLVSPFYLVTMFRVENKLKFLNNIYNKYKKNSKIFLIFLFISLSLLTTIEAWFRSTISTIYFVEQTVPLWLFTLLVTFIWALPKPKFYLFIGLILIFLGTCIIFTDVLIFINKAYGTLFFATGFWPLFDFINMKINSRSIIKELLEGNLTLLFAIFFISNFIASFVELFNFNVNLWFYTSPITDINYNYAFGWFLWWLVATIYLFVDVNDLSKP